jgi:epoxyqueuosine reductase
MKPFTALMRFLTRPAISSRMWILPSPPGFFRRRYASPRTPWSVELPPIPRELLTVPGNRRDRAAEQEAFASEPLQNFHLVHEESILWELAREWASFLPAAPGLARGERALRRTWRIAPAPPAEVTDPAELTSALKQRALELGFGAVGIARYDPKYTFVQHTGHQAGDRVVVCALEQNYGATDRTPSVLSNRAAYDSEADGMHMLADLAGFLHGRGYRARAHTTHEGPIIPYAVEAGLGQLGLNGQLLTPAAGSRCRLTMITTDAPLSLDSPVDYGIHGICDRCRACAERCPVGAIPTRRELHRGVWKAKINHSRCFPTVAQTHGCGVCMKVCPVQRYGLRAVLEEHARSGEILGRGTEELEGYVWPLDKRLYGPGEKPRLARSFFNPPGFNFEPGRKQPVARSDVRGS